MNLTRPNRTVTRAQPPDFSFEEAVVHVAMRASLAQGKSPVRYIGLGGDAPRKRTGQLWGPSSAEGCVRRNVYKASGCQPEQQVTTLKDQRIYDRGHVFGAWLAAYARAAEGHEGITDVECTAIDREEAMIVEPDVHEGGFLDIRFKRYGVPYFVEAKSKQNPEAMDRLTTYEPAHMRQLNDYMAADDVHQGWLVYFGPKVVDNMNSFGLVEFPHAFDPELWEDTKRKLELSDMMLRKLDRLGPITKKTFLMCPSCPYKKPCDASVTPAALLELQRGAR